MAKRTPENCGIIKRIGEPGKDGNGKCMGFGRLKKTTNHASRARNVSIARVMMRIDRMSISEQVKELRNKADIYNTVGSAWELNRAEARILQGLLRKAADTIETLSEMLQAANMERSGEDCGGWIPCKQRLPEEKG